MIELFGDVLWVNDLNSYFLSWTTSTLGILIGEVNTFCIATGIFMIFNELVVSIVSIDALFPIIDLGHDLIILWSLITLTGLLKGISIS